MVVFPPLNEIAGTSSHIYEAYFNQADTTKCGSIGALDAAKFLKKSGLQDNILSNIWDLADPNGKGYLEKSGFYVALKLIALSQQGLDVDISRVTADIAAPDLGPVPISPMGEDSSWAVKPSEKTHYDKIFDSLQPMNNKLSGDRVKPVLMNSKLPLDVLGRVWDMSDIDNDGFLDRDEFAVAMYLVYRALENDPVPASLPSSLVPPSKRRRPSMPGAIQVLPKLPQPPQHSRNDPTQTLNGTKPPLQWTVTPSAKASSDALFKEADRDGDGLVSGADVRDLMMQSGIDNNILAHIWTLCDSKNAGKLNNEQFALAMYLIQQKIAGVEPPLQLTPDMIPPSQRTANPMAFGVYDGTEAGPHSHAANFSSMKEIDMIAKEIEDIKKEKMRLENDSSQKQADLHIRRGDVQTLQKSLDAITSTLKQLETQKQDAQKKLDELDDKRSLEESNVKDMNEKCEKEQNQIRDMNLQQQNQASILQMQETELTHLRDELSKLRDEEAALEHKVEQGRTQLDNLMKSHDLTSTEISQVRKKLESYDSGTSSLFNGDLSFTSKDTFVSQSHVGGDISSINSLLSGNTLNGGGQGLNMFQTKDNFPVNVADISLSDLDPFQSTDPFKNYGSDDSFLKNNDPFKDAFSSTTKSKDDPFGRDPFSGGSDPFASAFNTSTTTSQDPFASWSSNSSQRPAFNDLRTAADVFGSDPFDPSASKTRSESPTPTLPPKQKKAAPPRPAPPRPKSGPSTNSSLLSDPFAGTGFESDPFANTDPFGSSDTKQDTMNFADFTPSKFDLS